MRRDFREIGVNVMVAPPPTGGMLTRVQVLMDEADWLKRGLFRRFMDVAVRAERMRQAGEPYPPASPSGTGWVNGSCAARSATCSG